VLRSGLTVGSTTDIGFIEPVRGAAVSGSMYSDHGARHRLGLRRPDAPMAMAWSAWTDSAGTFTFEGLPPGDYVVGLLGSDGDEWPVRIDSLADRIDLGHLSSAAGNLLSVGFGLPVGMEAERLAPVVRPVTLGPDGTVESGGRRVSPDERLGVEFLWRGLPPGDYEVDLADDQGNRWQREIVAFRGQDRHWVDLDVVALTGRIARGGEPLEDVMIWFGGLWGAERVSFRSRKEGRFQGMLPREGYWPVEVTPAPDCDPCKGGWDTNGWEGFDGTHVEDAGFVEIEPDETGSTSVLIDLAAASASGRVSWRNPESGAVEPVEGARVHVELEPDSTGAADAALLPGYWTTATDASGFFDVVGLSPGAYRITAEGWLLERQYRSEAVRFRVTGRDAMDDLDLRLEHQRRLGVVVRSGGAPLAGAQTFVRDAASKQGRRTNSRSDGSGTASHWLAAGTSAVDVVVRAGGLGMVGWRFDVREDQPVAVAMLPDRGSIRVPKFWDAVLRSPGGVEIPVSVLAGVDDRGQVQADGDEYVIRDLAPGTWMWCPAPGSCSSAEVLPWAETRVDG
jgi:hypothetical protein